jgi:hypothetical protein
MSERKLSYQNKLNNGHTSYTLNAAAKTVTI